MTTATASNIKNLTDEVLVEYLRVLLRIEGKDDRVFDLIAEVATEVYGRGLKL